MSETRWTKAELTAIAVKVAGCSGEAYWLEYGRPPLDVQPNEDMTVVGEAEEAGGRRIVRGHCCDIDALREALEEAEQRGEARARAAVG